MLYVSLLSWLSSSKKPATDRTGRKAGSAELKFNQLIERVVEELRGDTVEGFREAFKDTHITNKGDESIVLRLFENTLDKNTGR